MSQEEDEKERTSTIVCGLKRALSGLDLSDFRYKKIYQEINTLAVEISKASVLTSYFVNAMLVHATDAELVQHHGPGRGLAGSKYTVQAIFSAIMTLMSATACATDCKALKQHHVRAFYDRTFGHWLPREFPRPRLTRTGNSLSDTAIQMATNHRVYLDYTIPRRVAQFIASETGCCHRSALRCWFASRLNPVAENTTPAALPENPSAALARYLRSLEAQSVFIMMRHMLRSTQEKRARRAEVIANVKATGLAGATLTQAIHGALESHGLTSPGRMFTFSPVRNIGVHYIAIGKANLYIWGFCQPEDYRRLFQKRAGAWIPHKQIRTDGIAASLTYHRPLTLDAANGDATMLAMRKRKRECAPQPANPWTATRGMFHLDEHRSMPNESLPADAWEAFDPGFRQVFYGSDGTQMSSSQWRDDMSAGRATRHAKRRITGVKEIMAGLDRMPLETAEPARCEAAVKARLADWATLWNIYARPVWRRERFHQRQRQQKALGKITTQILGAKRDRIAVFGDAPFSVAVRNHLARHGRVLLVHEHLTSQVCSGAACGALDATGAGLRMQKWRSQYGVYRCGECGRLWNRDANAAQNIANIFAAHLAGEGRPAKLCRGAVEKIVAAPVTAAAAASVPAQKRKKAPSATASRKRLRALLGDMASAASGPFLAADLPREATNTVANDMSRRGAEQPEPGHPAWLRLLLN